MCLTILWGWRLKGYYIIHNIAQLIQNLLDYPGRKGINFHNTIPKTLKKAIIFTGHTSKTLYPNPSRLRNLIAKDTFKNKIFDQINLLTLLGQSFIGKE